MNESESIATSKKWGVVLLSVPSKHKKGIVKHLEEIFKLDRHDAEKILSNAPLILVDDLSLELASHVRDFFRKAGISAESTNHEVIKKNYWKVRWPAPPDLSFFMKNETGASENSAAMKAADPEKVPGASTSSESQGIGFQTPPDTEYQLPETSASGMDSDWAQRVSELDGKLRKIHREKVEAQEQRVEAIEKLKMESQMQLEEEKKKREELAAKAAEDLQREAERIRTLTEEKEEWHSKAVTSDEKVRALEADLQQRSSEIESLTGQKEDLIRQKEELLRQAEKAAEDLQKEAERIRTLTEEKEEWHSKAVTSDEKVRGLEADLQQRSSEIENLTGQKEDLIRQKEELSQQAEKAAAEAQQEISALRAHEQELLGKIEELERSGRQMAESLRFRDHVLAQFEKQIQELAAENPQPKSEA